MYKIMASFDSIPVQLAKDNQKFQYKVVSRGGTAGIFWEAIDWLKNGGIVYPINANYYVINYYNFGFNFVKKKYNKKYKWFGEN